MPRVQLVIDGNTVIDQEFTRTQITDFAPKGWSTLTPKGLQQPPGDTTFRSFEGPTDTVNTAIKSGQY